MPYGTPDISVIIAYHNRPQYIDEAMQSLLQQTLQPLEIIIINDGSNESSRRALDRYAGQCIIVDLPKSLGIGHARYLGVKMAEGEFIAFLDDDDVWLPEKLEADRRHMAEHPECDFVHGGVWWMFTDKPDEFYPLHWDGALPLAQALTHAYILIPSAIFVRTRAAKDVGFDPKGSGNEDRDFQIRFVAAGYRIESMGDTRVRIRRQGQDGWQKRYLRIFVAHMRTCWKNRAVYFRVYGFRGMLNVFLESAEFTTRNVRYLGGAVRLLIRVVGVNWKVRAGYQEASIALSPR